MAKQQAGGKARRRKPQTAPALPTPDQSDDDLALKVCRCGHPACFGVVFKSEVTSDDEPS